MSEHILQVQKLVWRGRSLARLPAGKVVLLSPGSFPGEKVRARVVQDKRDYVQARVEEILEPLPGRRPHPCPRAQFCGGCSFGVLPQRLQLELKQEVIQETLLRHLPRQDWESGLQNLAVFASRPAWRYRWRGQIQVRQGLPYLQGLDGSGLVYSPDCLLYSTALGQGLLQAASRLQDGRHVIAASPRDMQVKSASDPGLLDFPIQDYNICLQLPAGVFFQANWKLNQRLVRFVCSRLKGFKRVGDMYSGAGNFSLPLALEGCQVLALDADERSVAAGRANARRLGLSNLEFERLNLHKKEFLERLSRFNPEALVLDPPRSGAGKALQGLQQLESLQTMLWVSCDLVNTCRDLESFLGSGWRLQEMALFDMFPQTWHSELVLLLEKTNLL